MKKQKSNQSSDLLIRSVNWGIKRLFFIFVFSSLSLAYVFFCIYYQGYAQIKSPVFFIIEKALAIAACSGYILVLDLILIVFVNKLHNRKTNIKGTCVEFGVILLDLLKKCWEWIKTNSLTIIFVIVYIFIFLYFENKIIDAFFLFLSTIKESILGIALLWVLWFFLLTSSFYVIIQSIITYTLSDGRTFFISLILCGLFIYCTLNYPWGKNSPIEGYEGAFFVLFINYCFCFIVLPFIQFFRVAIKRNKYLAFTKYFQAGNYLVDSPVDSIINDELFFANHVRALKKRIDEIPVEGTHSIAITGGWGTGKTSFLKILQEGLQVQDQYEVVWFNPMTSSKSGNIQNDFFDTLENTLSKYKMGLGRRLKYYKELIGAIDNKYISFLIKLGNIQLKEEKERINDTIKMIPKKIIIIIDDVDRLKGDEIIQVFRIVGFNAEFDNVVFIIALDKRNVIKALGCDYNFPDKFFEMEFPLPNNYMLYTRRYFKSTMEKLVPEISMPFMDNHNIIKYTTYCISNMRDAKRFLNNFIDRVKMINKKLDLRSYYLLSLIQYKDPILYERVRAKDKELLGAESVSGIDCFVLNEDGCSKIGGTLSQMLRELFPSEKISDNASNLGYIYQSNYFDYYFNDTSTKAITDNMMLELLSSPTEEFETTIKAYTEEEISKQSIIEILERYGNYEFTESLLDNKDSERIISNYYKACGMLNVNIGLTYSEGLTPVKICRGKYAYINKQGDIAFTFECEHAFPFSEGLARVRQITKTGFYFYGFLNKTGELHIPFLYTNASNYSGSRANVSTFLKNGSIDKEGNFTGNFSIKAIKHWFVVSNK